jgi:uncharacterized membrane protein HdeD (DUF308 family)
LVATCLSFLFVTGGEPALGTLVACFALLTGALAIASARRTRKKRPAQPVRFVSHAILMAALILAGMAIISALLAPLLLD